MVICKKCGADNPLGRVFCNECGARLDLRNMTSGTLIAPKRTPWLKILLPKLIASLIALALIPLALAAWPRTQPIGKRGTRTGGQRVIGDLQGLLYLRKGLAVERQFTEEDLNGYFEHFKAKKLKADTVSVRILRGQFVVRFVRILGPFKLGPIALQPRVSNDLVCVPAAGRVRVARVTLGHWSALGPFRAMVLRPLLRQLAAEPEWKAFQHLTEIRAEEGKLWVSAAMK